MIVWGGPWDPETWEVTHSFLRHYVWTIRGCQKLVMNTNYWRLQCREAALDFGKVLLEEVR